MLMTRTPRSASHVRRPTSASSAFSCRRVSCVRVDRVDGVAARRWRLGGISLVGDPKRAQPSEITKSGKGDAASKPCPAPGHVVAGVALAVAAHLGLVEVGRVAQEPAVEGRRQRVVAHPCAEVGPRRPPAARPASRQAAPSMARRRGARMAGWPPFLVGGPSGRASGRRAAHGPNRWSGGVLGGRAVQFWLRAGEIHNRFCGLTVPKSFLMNFGVAS